jgi:hypothetical protein
MGVTNRLDHGPAKRGAIGDEPTRRAHQADD